MLTPSNDARNEFNALEVIILDVGHGNCAVVYDGTARLIIDVAHERIALEELGLLSNTQIEHLVLSHADADHIKGAVALLAHSEMQVGTLWVNPDGTKDSETFIDLMYVARDRHRSGKLNVSTNLNVGVRNELSSGRIQVEVLHPGIVFALSSSSRIRRPDGVITSNGMSAVVRVSLDGEQAVLLPGDLDAVGLNSIRNEGVDLSAPVLVFPHHGGHSAGHDNRTFARELCEVVQPRLVVFSHGRSKFRNPRPEIVAGIRDAVNAAEIICTQLSRSCQFGDNTRIPSHLLGRPARGKTQGACCGGSVLVGMSQDGIYWEPSMAGHARFVDMLDAPLCRGHTTGA